ncbi:MAG: hypothetical protein JMDDDDMK_04049 [Acidobacteria bacterium]|nr:hypothetical protein [Acidobacteriota bacterium]
MFACIRFSGKTSEAAGLPVIVAAGALFDDDGCVADAPLVEFDAVWLELSSR